MKLGKSAVLIILTSLVIGCASPPMTLNYAPSSVMSLEGEVKVGDFKYLPGENNDQVKMNQIRNTALGSVYFEKNIDEYFETAVFTESRFVGLNVNDSSNVVSGEIIEFLIDDLGFSVDWTLEVKYQVAQSNSSACYSQVHKIQKNTAKFANPFGTLNEIMKLNIEKAFSDEAFVSCVSKKG